MNIKIEKSLVAYFQIYFLFEEQIENKQELYKCISKVFNLTNKEEKKVMGLLNHKDIASIYSLQDFEIAMRAIHYNKIIQTPLHFDDGIERVLACMNLATNVLKKHLNKRSHVFTSSEIMSLILSLGDSDDIRENFIAGIVYGEGIIVAQNKEKAIKLFKKCINYNMEEACLFALKYDCDARKENLTALNSILEIKGLSGVYDSIFKMYSANSEDIKKLDGFKLINSFQNKHYEKMYIYDKDVVSVAFSGLSDYDTKCKLLQHYGTNLWNDIKVLPVSKGVLNSNKLAGIKVSKERRLEMESIITSLNDQLNDNEKMIPLIIGEENESYAINIYLKTALGDNTKVISIDMENLSSENSFSEIILHDMCRYKNQAIVFMLYNLDCMKDLRVSEARKFIRAKLKNDYYSYKLDIPYSLANITFCAFAKSDAIDKNLVALFNITNCIKVNDSEKLGITEIYANNFAKKYGVNVVIEKSAHDSIVKYSVEHIKSSLRAICKNCNGVNQIVIDALLFDSHVKKEEKSQMCFNWR